MAGNIRVSVIGLGKLGSPLLAVLGNSGFEAVGVDLNKSCVDQINSRIAPVFEPRLQEYIANENSKIRATADYEEAIVESDLTFIIVPTPSNADGSFSNEYVLSAVREISKALKRKKTYHVINITSTVMPGSCDGEIRKAIEKYSDRHVGRDVGLCYNPEFIALGSVIKNMEYPDMCLIGQSDENAGNMLAQIYTRICKNNPKLMRMSLVNAEITKIAVNTFVTTKISYANMLSDLCARIPGASALEVCEAIGMDSRIGQKYIKPGPAFGGPCFPRDNQAFIRMAKSLGACFDLATATKDINDYQTIRLVSIIESISVNKWVGFIGASYKSGTPIIEESAATNAIDVLLGKGIKVCVYDEFAEDNLRAKYGDKVAIMSGVADLVYKSHTIVSTLERGSILIDDNAHALRGLDVKNYIDCWGGDSRSMIENLGLKYYSLAIGVN